MTSSPAELPLFPLESVVLYPTLRVPLHIFEPRYRQMMESALHGDRMLGMVTVLSEHRHELSGRPPIFDVGCAGFIEAFERLADGRFNLMLHGIERFRVLRERPAEPGRLYRVAEIEWLEEEAPAPAEAALLDASRERVMEALCEILVRAGSDPDELASERLSALDHATFTNTICQMLSLPAEEKQTLLRAAGPSARLDVLDGLLQLHLARLRMPFGPSNSLH